MNTKGLVFWNLGNYTEAIKYFNKALTIDPKYQFALDNKKSVLDILNKRSTQQFVTYKNLTYGVLIKYPSDWTKVENKTDPNNLVKFKKVPIVEAQVGILKSPQRLNINDYLDYHAKATQNLKDYQLVESNTNSSLSGQPAYKLAYFYTDDYGIKKEWIEMGTFIDSKLYWIAFTTNADQTSNYLLTMQKMVDSFTIQYVKSFTIR